MATSPESLPMLLLLLLTTVAVMVGCAGGSEHLVHKDPINKDFDDQAFVIVDLVDSQWQKSVATKPAPKKNDHNKDAVEKLKKALLGHAKQEGAAHAGQSRGVRATSEEVSGGGEISRPARAINEEGSAGGELDRRARAINEEGSAGGELDRRARAINEEGSAGG
eukprot:scpid104886/ scgid31280/ 